MKPHLRPEEKRRPSLFGRAAYLFVVFGIIWGAYQALYHPQTPLPTAWNPVVPLIVDDPVTPLTGWKLERAVATPATCFAALGDSAGFSPMPDLENTENCHIRGRLALGDIAGASVAPIETRCAIALRMAMWVTHDLEPAAQEFFQTSLARIDHIGSYNCRPLRTTAGPTERWSTHATADAIDISGFGFSDGTRLRLIDDWDAGGPSQGFLRRARDTACEWFRVTLSPDYNTLHADHFHLQSRGWGLCR